VAHATGVPASEDRLESPVTPTDPLVAAVAHAAHLLPDQGPIGVFVHHNTLHAFQHLPFHAAVREGAAWWGARPYPESSWFREAWRAGRIESVDLEACLPGADGGSDGDVVSGLGRRALQRALLLAAPPDGDEAGIAWSLRQGTLSAPPDLLAAATQLVHKWPAPPVDGPLPRRHRDALLALGGEDVDQAVNPDLVRLSAAYLDQGQALMPLPGRRDGFFAAVCALHKAGAGSPAGCPGSAQRFVRSVGRPALEVLRETMAELGVAESELSDVLTATALALRGWAGMFARLERRPDEQEDGVEPRLVEFLAVRMVYESCAIRAVAGRVGAPVSWQSLRSTRTSLPPRPLAEALLLVSFAQAAGWSPAFLSGLSAEELAALRAEVQAFGDLEQRATWLEAYESRYRRQILDAIAARASLPQPAAAGPPKAQVMFCIDEREESMRRAIEEQGPEWETLGAAGFFGVAIEYRGLDDHYAAAYCPAVVEPAHEVAEVHTPAHDEVHEQRLRWRSLQHAVERGLGGASHTLTGGAAISVILAPVLGAITAARIFAPSRSLAWAERVRAWTPRPDTRLSSVRDADVFGESGKPLGFTVGEAADRVAGLLANTGLTGRLAPLVMVLGHGSTSLNNPHESAHDCGACGGRRGGANARLIADLANRPDVRAELARRGNPIPDDTWFVGGLHDTSSDAVLLADLDRVPEAFRARLDELLAVVERARKESAAERCRRFDDVPLPVSPDAGLRHVEDRASHLGQPRPEYGHCTNAVAFVGRRSTVRGLHLDRRTFLVSHDPTTDPTGAVLERILAAVGPVGAGINLEYYFSSTDNEVFGCGTKLPHNVTGLVGVMAGHQGDLRTGLPLQMVEIHEPMRLLLIVEATPERLLEIAGRQAEVRELVVNRWVQLVSMNPETGALAVFGDAGFVPYTPGGAPLPEVERSADWHGLRREHLPPALVRAGLAP
jgi:uncharacterized protein